VGGTWVGVVDTLGFGEGSDVDVGEGSCVATLHPGSKTVNIIRTNKVRPTSLKYFSVIIFKLVICSTNT
jgi:hypothetical protein